MYLPIVTPKNNVVNLVEISKRLNGLNSFKVESLRPWDTIYQKKRVYTVFLRFLNKCCLNKLENDKAGSISIKQKNKMPVIFFHHIHFPGNKLSLIPSRLTMGSGKTETETRNRVSTVVSGHTFWRHLTEGSRSKGYRHNHSQWPKERLRRTWLDEYRNIKLSNFVTVPAYVNHISLVSNQM